VISKSSSLPGALGVPVNLVEEYRDQQEGLLPRGGRYIVRTVRRDPAGFIVELH
jgi:hypothetical protein